MGSLRGRVRASEQGGGGELSDCWRGSSRGETPLDALLGSLPTL